ncbi:MAG: type III polyketide synthase [Bacteroidota bacterium]
MYHTAKYYTLWERFIHSSVKKYNTQGILMLVDITTASPPFMVEQAKATEELKKRMAVTPVAGRMIDMASHHSGISQRYFVVPDGGSGTEKKFYSNSGGYISPDTGTRMNEYERWSKELTGNAVAEILAKNSVDPGSVERLITISCTGFFAPGLDYYLIDRFNFPASVKRTNIGFMGCAASLIGFNTVLESMSQLRSANGKTLLVSVELCSLHLQTEPTRDNILANMIFADGCAAALFNSPSAASTGLQLLFTSSYLFKDSAEYMGWKIGNTGFEMVLSSELPKIILNNAAPALKDILSQHQLSPEQITHWALHPGGRAILDSLQNGMNISDEKMIPSRTVLKNYGNLSSASILFVLKELMKNTPLKNDELICAVAFGPGLTMEVALLKVRA